MAGIYIHIPFCKKKCSYCDFYSVATRGYADLYVKCLAKELQLRSDEIDLKTIDTVYVGGGTPSVLTEEQMKSLFEGVWSVVDFSKVKEVTVEVNPDDVTEKYIKNLVVNGVNRISMGVQSLVDSELKSVNRRHNAKDAIEAVATIKRAGIYNISIDLIYGLPGQTIDSWKYSVENVLKLGVSHISAYNLSYEEGTLLSILRDQGKIKEVEEDVCVAMYDLLVDKLCDAGFEHYEISNFALPGMYSRHNSNYWNSTPYLGIGAAAHSYDGCVRRYNPSDLKVFISSICDDRLVYEEEQEEWWQRYNEMVMIRLRTMWGIDVAEISHTFGENIADRFCRVAARYVDQSLLVKDGTRYIITRQGVMLSDGIIRDLMYVED